MYIENSILKIDSHTCLDKLDASIRIISVHTIISPRNLYYRKYEEIKFQCFPKIHICDIRV